MRIEPATVRLIIASSQRPRQESQNHIDEAQQNRPEECRREAMNNEAGHDRGRNFEHDGVDDEPEDPERDER